MIRMILVVVMTLRRVTKTSWITTLILVIVIALKVKMMRITVMMTMVTSDSNSIRFSGRYKGNK